MVSPPPAMLTSRPSAVSSAAASATSIGAVIERLVLEGAERAVPDQRLRARQAPRSPARRCAARCRGSCRSRRQRRPQRRASRTPAANFGATTTSTGSTIRRPPALALARMSRAVGTRSGSTSDLPTGLPSGEQERVGHGAADDQRVDIRHQVAEEIELGRDLGAADDGRDRARPARAAPCSSASSSSCMARPA